MKNIILTTILLSLSLVSGYSQFEFGVKAGISSFDLASEGIVIRNEDKIYELNFANAEYGVHFGIYSRVSFLGLYVEPAILFNSNTVNYDLQEVSEDGAFSTLRSETYRNVDIPFLIGTKIGFLRLQTGPVAHFYLDSTSDLFSINGYKQNFKSATYGAQIGVGLDIWRVRFDINYELNTNKFGDHIQVGDDQLTFDDGAERVVMSMGLKF